MFYQLSNKTLIQVPFEAMSPARPSLAFASIEEARMILPRYSLPDHPMEIALGGKSMVHESHDSFDFAYLKRLGYEPSDPEGQVCLYHSKNLLLLAGGGMEEWKETLTRKAEGDEPAITLERILIRFLERFTGRSPEELENIEEKIEDLESRVLSEKGGDVIHELLALRKDLTTYKRHYEQLLFVLDMFAEDPGELITDRGERALQLLSSRTSRLYQTVQELQAYVTQVRESYQAELDISMNRTMRFFTVITSIFLPLTLIAGWYGMNLRMPEFQWDLAYPSVIAVSLLILVFLLVYFKKNKWF